MGKCKTCNGTGKHPDYRDEPCWYCNDGVAKPHSPGPWTLEPKRLGDKVLRIREARTEVDFDDVDHGEQLANARLIAAAPELYAAVKAMLEDYEDGRTIPVFAVRQMCRAALGKVEGE